MTAPKALVIGGARPTRAFLAEDLVERGYQVTILHGGQNGIEFAAPDVPHTHADPHFKGTVATAVQADVTRRHTVDWIRDHLLEPGDELEQQVGDPFADYADDELVKRRQGALPSLAGIKSPPPSEHRQPNQHPRVPGEKGVRL